MCQTIPLNTNLKNGDVAQQFDLRAELRKCCPGQRAMAGTWTRSAAARCRAGQWDSVQLEAVSIHMKTE